MIEMYVFPPLWMMFAYMEWFNKKKVKTFCLRKIVFFIAIWYEKEIERKRGREIKRERHGERDRERVIDSERKKRERDREKDIERNREG